MTKSYLLKKRPLTRLTCEIFNTFKTPKLRRVLFDSSSIEVLFDYEET